MPKQVLKSNLDKLKKELASTHDLDSATREQLAELAETIEQVLDESETDFESARARVEDVTLRFEAEHPRFARILGEVTDALAKLGI